MDGRNHPACKAFTFLLVVLCIARTASAQEFRQYKDFDRYRYFPRMPEGTENPPPLPDVPRDVTGDPKVLVEKMTGLIVVDSPDDVVPGKLDTQGIHVRVTNEFSLAHTDGFRRIVQSYLGGPISIRRLNEMVREIILYYRENDEPVVDVSVPEQDITDGVVQIVLTESRVGEVRVEGPCYFDPCVLAEQVCISPGDVIYESVLLEDLRWLYRNPFRTVDLELTPGKNRGETDVVFKVYDQHPMRVYAGYEDTGTRFTGLERTFYGVNWYNAFNRDDHTGYQYTTSADFDTLRAHSAFYSTALPNRDILTLYGAYADVLSPLPNQVDNQGVAWQLLLRWNRELCPHGCYEHGIMAGFDYKLTNTNLEFGGIQIFDTAYNIAQFMVGYKALSYDGWGSWRWGVDAYYSPGYLGGLNTRPTFEEVRAGARPNYFYSRAFYERRIWLPRDLEFVARFTGQLADGNLMPTEQLGFGGYNSIRGYDLFSIVGDSGYFVNLEIQTAPYHIHNCCDNELRFLTFYDFGNAYNHVPLPTDSNLGNPNVDLSSVGVGARLKLPPRIELRVDYGWQISKAPVYLLQPEHRVHIGAVYSY